jgi:hypothetical protein
LERLETEVTAVRRLLQSPIPNLQSPILPTA